MNRRRGQGALIFPWSNPMRYADSTYYVLENAGQPRSGLRNGPGRLCQPVFSGYDPISRRMPCR
jgi:hypothetical protein